MTKPKPSKSSKTSTPMSTRIDHPAVATSLDGLPLPAPPHRALLLVFVALCSGLVLTHWLESRSAARMQVGYLRAERTLITAPADVTISELRRSPGTIVEPGQVIAVLWDPSLEDRLATLKGTLALQQARLAQARAKAEVELARVLTKLEGEQFEVQTLTATHLQKQYQNEYVASAWEDMIEQSDGVASTASNDEIFRLGSLQQWLTSDEARVRALIRKESAKHAATVSADQVLLCRNRITRLEELQAKLPAQVKEAMGVDVAKREIEETDARINELTQLRDRLTLRATSHGTLGRFLKQTGDRVKAGEPVVELYDRERQYIDLPVPSRLIDRYELGTLLKLRFAGGIKSRGRVAVVPSHTEQNVETPVGNDPLVRLVVERVGKLWPEVPVGSLVEVEVE